jgi:segregation and condensation protein B
MISLEHMDSHEVESAIEAILFASGEPVKISRIADVLGVSESEIEHAADRLRDNYSFARRGIRLVRLENTLQLLSSPEYADYIRRALETRKPPQLSQSALEVLSIIAYFGPVTRAYIEQIRGVDSSYTVGLLQERGLVEPCGRLAAPGRPVLFRTTHVFLRTFGLESLKELPELPQVEGKSAEREGIQNAISELKAREEEQAYEYEQTGESEPVMDHVPDAGRGIPDAPLTDEEDTSETNEAHE